MKIIKFLTLVSLLIITLLLTESCDKTGEVLVDCTNTICNNGGTCVDGVCDCPNGTIGTNCESFDLTQIQALLDDGKTPKELYDGNVPLENLYGKIYKDGFIFYLNVSDGTGLVAALSDQGDWVPWGCWGQNIMGLNDVIGGPLDPEIEVGSRIGDGAANTDAILAECTDDGIAARLCRDLGEEWFLPSRKELNLMYINLHKEGHGGFAEDVYWSSTETNGEEMWFQFFAINLQDFTYKHNDHVRAARVF